MIRINLLFPHKTRKPAETPWIVKGFWMGLAGLVLVGLGVYGFLAFQVKGLKQEGEELKRQTQSYPLLLKEIQELKEKKEIAQKRLVLLETLEKERHGPVRLMEQLTVLLPVNQLWLTTLKENGPEVRLDGMALSNEILAEYMKRLEASPLVQAVELVQSAQVIYKDVKVKQFTLTAWLRNSGPAAEAPK
jgi:type IV pilus assembly protein PilN